MIVLGIDPGTHRMGYGVIQADGRNIKYLEAGILPISKGSTEEMLFGARETLKAVIEKWSPEYLSIEKIFFSKNQKTAMRVAEARGVVLATSKEAGLKVLEFSPNEIKLSLTGYGSSDKKAVAKMVALFLKTSSLSLIDDAMDALASAITGAQHIQSGALKR